MRLPSSRRLVPGVVLLGSAAFLAAQPATAKPPPFTGVYEQQLTTDPAYANGEPSIAVNPTNPRNILITYLVNTGFGAYGAQNGILPPEGRTHEQNIQGCDYLRTFDGGRTWARGSLPISSFEMDPTRPNCSDTLVVFDRKGTAHVIGSSFQFPTFAAGQGDFRLISSKDGGRTWSKPSIVAPAALSPGSDPAAWKGARFYDDREFMAFDPVNGQLYVNGTQGRADAQGSAGNMEYLTTSRDGGRTWSDAKAVGEASAVQLAAAYGIVAFTSPPPASEGRECDCVDFLVSTDGGRTVKRQVTAIPGSRASTVADPRHKGHFALVSVQGGKLVVYRTNDAGRSFNKTATIAVPGRGASKLWLDWSRRGVLGIGWRATNADGGWAFYGAVSYDDGKRFSVTKISKADSPGNDPLWVAGDDTSAIWLTDDRFYAVWGDWRGGSLQTWWGGFPLRH